MPRVSTVACSLVLLIAALPCPAADRFAPVLRGAPAPTPDLRQLVRSSGYIFRGTVVGVRPGPVRPGAAPALICVQFRIDDAVRGVRTGQLLTISEWAGLWVGGDRYRPGERVFLFLYPVSRAGLTSPVAGPLGRYRMQGEYVDVGPARARQLFRAGLRRETGKVRGSSHPAYRDFAAQVRTAMEGR